MQFTFIIMYKKFYYLFGAILLLITVSCSENSDDCNFSTDISILANIEDSYLNDGSHKTIFESGDAIGVYMVDYENDMPQKIGTPNNFMNVEYVLNNSYWSNPSNNNLQLTNPYSMSEVYAYYPYDSEMGTTTAKNNLEAYPFSVKTDQSNSLSENDFLWAKYDSIYIGNTVACLTFKHLLSKMTINIVINDYNYNVNDILILNIQTSCKINMNNGDVIANGNINQIIPYIEPNPINKFENTLNAIVIPQTIVKGTPLFSIPNNGITYVYTTDEDLYFKQGTAYEFNMVIGGTDDNRNLVDRRENVVYKEISIEKISFL